MALNIAEVVLRATAEGWATVNCDLGDFRKQAVAGGLVEMPVRTGEKAVQILRPRSREQAMRRSLSAVHGTGAQPLHTDGAHHPAPPDLIVMAAAARSPTPTLLWRPTLDDWWREHTTTGVFLVDGGRRRFLATAEDASGLRFDPGCMTPRDPHARRLAVAMAAAVDHATPHWWSEPAELLVIANRTALHARAAVAHGDADRTLRRVAFCGTIRG